MISIENQTYQIPLTRFLIGSEHDKLQIIKLVILFVHIHHIAWKFNHFVMTRKMIISCET